ncbi:MAG: diguanylate cyclase [Anaerolineales bacterium]|nr:diguanylate cyclase [Anaerolineales bacterium]
MSVRLKTLFAISLAFLCLLGILYYASNLILSQSVVLAEERSTSRDVDRVLAALNNEVTGLDMTVGDWAPWDDTYKFVKNGNVDYIESNLTEDTFSNLRLNLILIVNQSNEIVYGEAFDLNTGLILSLPEVFSRYIQDGTPLLAHKETTDSLAGILMLNEKPIIVASQPILTSQGEGPIHGTLIMGRHLDEAVIAKMARQTQLSINLYKYDDEALPADVAQVRPTLSSQESISVKPLDENVVAGYAAVNDIDGNPALIMRVETPRDAYTLANTTRRYFALALIIIGLVFGFVTILLMERIVLIRLAGLNANVKRIGSQGDATSRVEIKGNDEIAGLATSVNSMLDSIQQSQRKGRESEERYRAVVEQTSDGIFLFDVASRKILDANSAYAGLIGYSLNKLRRLTVYDLFEQDKKDLDLYIDRIGQNGQRFKGEYLQKRADGTTMDVEISADLISIGGRKVICVVLRDITDRKTAEAALRESEERYALAAQGANDGLWDWDLRTNKIHFSDRWKEMAGCKPEEIGEIPEEWFSRVHPDDLVLFQTGLTAHLEGGSSQFESEHRLKHNDGSYYWRMCRGLAVRAEDGTPTRLAGSLTDITERKSSEERLIYDAMHDALTGLPNRALLLDRLEMAMARAQRHSSNRFAILFLDLDRFKIVNDSLGHLAGDEMLIEVSRRLSGCARRQDTVSRMGGDEFVVLVEDNTNIDVAPQVATRIQTVLSKPFNIRGQDVFSSASIGITYYHPGYQKPEELLRDADIAMYRAKAAGRARHVIFDYDLTSGEGPA